MAMVVVPAALVSAVEMKDGMARGHNRRVADLAANIGRELGMGPADLEILERAGLLHDVGKLRIPDAILAKHDPLDDSEWRVMKTHPELGLTILQWAGEFKRELLAVLYHHERMDGSGYPHGLVADQIPIEARIVAVADTYDVLTSDRPYRQARNKRQARRVLQQEAGAHLDRAVVGALLRFLDGPRGHLEPVFD
jgi:putative nucleotidyltransferase with HDIG domain